MDRSSTNSPKRTFWRGSPPTRPFTRPTAATHMTVVQRRIANVRDVRFENLFVGLRYRASRVPRTCSSRREKPISQSVKPRNMLVTKPYVIMPAKTLRSCPDVPGFENAKELMMNSRMITNTWTKRAMNAIG